ncbi:PREDICTED: phosphoserine phosphatase [Ceratosolen solmsi marchali]|uniref:Phosphoserine phosphatase n=1 Tax=Ceratosolen solmsi marchali TaxID=326594 RepID=A0AAJ6YCG4_9HYME|nr:PREDICTED: phosphoserine phosphatase [Ceratosolen solmsi marchali]XP_011494937.1 PREDICTED: phosphoserine phosphatase [Ceratosolen solmsi marchali]XP_011494938.1 PREDICTED: phosphoserine phosphatase [Ceratosolen solmsi marchali]
MANLDEVKMVWRLADAVSFDVDSTVIVEEGIDELAKFCGKGDQVASLTKQAMQGNMTFQQSLTIRLNIIQPSFKQIKEFIHSHPPKLTPGIKSLIQALQIQKKQVYLVSGGFYCLIAPVAVKLNIPLENIRANKLKFYFTGEYAGFDENEPTSHSGGKAEAIKRLKEEKGFKTVVHIGDGATDLEACPPANAFIGYGGNIIRESVKAHAPWFIMDFKDLQAAL